jgi:hypothetical protein
MIALEEEAEGAEERPPAPPREERAGAAAGAAPVSELGSSATANEGR